MYILIIARGYPSEKYKMNGIFEFDQAKALKELGHKVVYMALDLRSFRRSRQFGYESLNRDHIPIEAINVPLGNIYRKLMYMIGTHYAKCLYLRIVKQYGQPDIIHTHFTQTTFMVTKALKKYKVPIVFTEHSSLMNNPNLSQKLIDQSKSIIESVDKVIVVGKSLADNLKKHFDVDSILIPNVVDTSIFTYQNVEAHDDFRFVSIGSLIIRKNMGLLINSFQQAFSNQLNIKLSIYGEGSLTQSLIEQINQLGLQDQITLHGLKSRTVLAGALQNSDCFVLASKSETFGVVYIEALAVGVPVIATRCGGPEDFVTKDNGILIDVDDDRQLIKALQTMVKTSHTYDRHEISTQTKNQFSPEAIANQLSQLYTEVIEGKR